MKSRATNFVVCLILIFSFLVISSFIVVRYVLCSNVWPIEISKEIFSLPKINDGKLYFGASNGIFYSVDIETGKMNWKKSGFEEINSNAVVYNNKVYFKNIYGKVFCLETNNGSKKWEKDIKGSIANIGPKIIKNSIFISSKNQLIVLDPKNGDLLNNYSFEGEGCDFSWNSQGIAIVINNEIDISDSNIEGKGLISFFKYNISKPIWQVDLGGLNFGSIVCDEKYCYVGARNGKLYALNIENGDIVWQINANNMFSFRKGIVWADGFIKKQGEKLIFSVNHQNIEEPSLLLCVSKSTGKMLWSIETPTSIWGEFIVIKNMVIAITEDRQILTSNLDTGDFKLHKILPEDERGEFAGLITNNRYIFISGADGYVRRFLVDDIIKENQSKRGAP
ncbi:MAG: PQQ-like beta-propeller repeat protein [Candidatus Aureabacteria bacterium]|nr:PQQ-like beta-propeller repeat protein [Candidatus Auribacterota bacterium]